MNSRNSHYRVMRLLVLYDLPTTSKRDLKYASTFRKNLISRGFLMMQESIYIKQCLNNDVVNRVIMFIEKNLPPNGDVRILAITEKQYMDMKILVGEKSFDEKLADEGNLLLI